MGFFNKPLHRIYAVTGTMLLLLLLAVTVFKHPKKQSQPNATTKIDQQTTAKMAIVIDDVGYRMDTMDELLSMPAAITFAVIPNAPHAAKLSQLARQHGHQVIIHLPLQPSDPKEQDPGSLTVDMSESQMRILLESAMNTVPNAVGLNNHTGSLFSKNQQAADRLMNALKDTPLFFLDSKTVAGSVLAETAEKYGIDSLQRDLFLDHDIDEEKIYQQLLAMKALANKSGAAIAIGHPYPETIAAINRFLNSDNATAAKQLVALSKLLLN